MEMKRLRSLEKERMGACYVAHRQTGTLSKHEDLVIWVTCIDYMANGSWVGI